jgi:hypothetical protein
MFRAGGKLAREFHMYRDKKRRNTGIIKKLIIKEEQKMKKMLSTILVTCFVVLSTATFTFAEYSATAAGNFPFFHLGALIVGGLIIISLKHKYQKLYMSEAVGSFALYTVLIALFTSPVVDLIKGMVG